MGKIAEELKSFDKSLRDDEVALGKHDVVVSGLDLKGVAPKIREVETRALYAKNSINLKYVITQIFLLIDEVNLAFNPIVSLRYNRCIKLDSIKNDLYRLKAGEWTINSYISYDGTPSTRGYTRNITEDDIKNNNCIEFYGTKGEWRLIKLTKEEMQTAESQ